MDLRDVSFKGRTKTLGALFFELQDQFSDCDVTVRKIDGKIEYLATFYGLTAAEEARVRFIIAPPPVKPRLTPRPVMV